MLAHFLADMAQQTSTVKKPNYNRHFPRSFMLNYRAALQDLSNEKILSRLKDFNCEWLSRPNIAISKMAQSIKDNWPLIEKSKGKVFTRKFVQVLSEVILLLMVTYARLDNKDNSTHDPPTHDDVLDALEVINVNPEVEELMITAFNAAGPVLMTSIQMLAVNALLHNVMNFAYEAVRSPATEDFKANYLFSSILMKRRAVERQTSLYDRSRLADCYALPDPSSRANSRTRRQAPLPGPEEDEPQPASRPSRPRLGEHQRSSSQSWRQNGQQRNLAIHDDNEPVPLFPRRTSTPSSSFSSRGSQRRRSAISVDSAIDVEEQQSSDEVEELPRPTKKRQKRPPTATVTTVQPVSSPRKRPATDDEVAGKADTPQKSTKNAAARQKWRRRQNKSSPQACPRKRTKTRTKRSTPGPGLQTWPKTRTACTTT